MNKRRVNTKYLSAFLILTLFFAGNVVFAQKVVLTTEEYLEPPKEVLDIITAPRHENVTLRNLGPDGKHFVIEKASGLISLDVMAKPFYNLGEIEFDFTANRLRRLSTRYSVGFEILNRETMKKTAVQIPKDAKVTTPVWSPDGTKFAYFAHFNDKTEIWVADVKDGKSKRVTKKPVLATRVTNFQWSPDGQSILTVLIPEKRAAAPTEADVAPEPKVRITTKKTPARTYRFLLQTPLDKERLEYYSTGQLAMVNVSNSKVTKIGEPQMFTSASLSPDAKHVRVSVMQKPFSYIAPVRNFGSKDEIWSVEGEMLALVSERKLREATVGGGGFGNNNASGKRNVSWRADGKGLSYLEMEKKKKETETDEESGEEEEKRKDRVMLWMPPFDDDSKEIVYESEKRIGSVNYSPDAQTLFMTETVDGKQHLFAVRTNDTSTKHTIYKHKTSDRYNSPGRLMTRRLENGAFAVRMSGAGEVYLSGTKTSKTPETDAPRPFIDRVVIETGVKTNVFTSSATVYENLLTPVDNDMKEIVISRESPKMVPDSYVRSNMGSLKKLTNNVDHTPMITNAKRSYHEITRVDGKKFWSRITLPEDYVEGTKLPALIWFYPREYTSQKQYNERRRYNKNSFPAIRTRSWETFTTLGYALIQPDLPIFGVSGRMNDNYHQDLLNGLWAIIDHFDKMGYIDRDRLGIGGHSYGGMGTAHAMNNTPFFKAGIAGHGNYNRTLTPVTFQSERRWLWDARETYTNMSAILRANQLNGALLMYHGMDDANTGTFPINSERMFHALNSLGKTAALYMYPYEHHGPITRETQVDMWARWVEWMDTYVKNHGKKKEKVDVDVKDSGKNGKK